MTSVFPQGDYTPTDYRLPVTTVGEWIKRFLRQFIYPIYNAYNHRLLARRYATADFKLDLWLWGQRGNDYERHRRRVERYVSLGGREILVAGCGTARDIESWIRFKPQRIVGIDWFSYARAWTLLKRHYAQITPATEVHFAQADLAHMSDIPDASVDVISSDAVFEHLKNLPEVLIEFHRILRPGGVLYATFGPLWYGYGGDHVSGYDAVTSGYNHLLLNVEDYQHYLDNMGTHTHSEHDGRTWIKHDLFSRLTPRQYLDCLQQAGFKRLFVSAVIDPLAVACLTAPQFDKTKVAHLDHLDLLISGMTIIYER